MKTIKKSIEINASPENVWDVLFNEKFNKSWYEEFSEGSRGETDWEVGSKAVFTDKTGNGLIAKITANKPYEILSMEYEGVVKDGVEIYDNDEANELKGGHEIYRLSGKEGITHLSIESDMSEEYLDRMASAWERALQKIKVLSELIE